MIDELFLFNEKTKLFFLTQALTVRYVSFKLSELLLKIRASSYLLTAVHSKSHEDMIPGPVSKTNQPTDQPTAS